jgi:hypothetical protein
VQWVPVGMTDQPAQDETDFPTRCEVCGTELETGMVGVEESDIGNEPALPSTTVMELFCPNPECPAHKPEARPGEQSPEQ